MPDWVTSAGIQSEFQCEQNQKHQFGFGNRQRHPEPVTPPGCGSPLCLSSPDAGSLRSHRRPRRCWPGPLLHRGSPGHPRRKRCTGLLRPGWGPCTPARRGPNRPPACTSGRPGKTGQPWRWTDRKTGGSESREAAVLERGGGVYEREKTEQREIRELGKLIRYSSVSEPISQTAS